MGDLIKLAKAWARVAMISRVAIAVALAISALSIAYGDGGTFLISWTPGGE